MLSSLVFISMPFSDFSENIYYCVNHSSDDDNWICGHEVCPPLLIQLSLELTKSAHINSSLNQITSLMFWEKRCTKNSQGNFSKRRWGRLWWLTTLSQPNTCSHYTIIMCAFWVYVFHPKCVGNVLVVYLDLSWNEFLKIVCHQKHGCLDFPDTTPENIRTKLPYNNYRIAPVVLTDKSVYVIK